ncbi:MAG: hypothetical protein ACTSVV_16700, partial [Promethearchaeota archaeon]
KKVFYRLSELYDSKELDKYIRVIDFNKNIVQDWLASQQGLENIEDLKKIEESISKEIHNVESLFEDKWTNLFEKEKTLWDSYWNKYIELHNSLPKLISDKVEILKKEKDFKILTQKDLANLTNIFRCNFKLTIPNFLQDNNFTCPKCNSSYSRLELYKMRINDEFKKLMDKIKRSITPPIIEGDIDTGPILPPSHPSPTILDKWEIILKLLKENKIDNDVIINIPNLLNETEIDKKYSLVLKSLIENLFDNLIITTNSEIKYKVEELINSEKTKLNLNQKFRICSMDDYPKDPNQMQQIQLTDNEKWAFDILIFKDNVIKTQMQNLLYNILIVNGKDDRQKFREKYGNKYIIVTLNGEFQFSDGSIIVG